MSATNFKQLLNDVKAFVFDVDGVLTNGSLLVLQGELFRTMNIRDGFALQAAVKAGYHVIIISGGKSESVRARLANLGVKNIFLGIEDKKEKLEELLIELELRAENILYMGDDVPDYSPMKICGVATCPADAATEIKEISIYVSDKKGGDGCARDVIEQVMRLHGKWNFNE